MDSSTQIDNTTTPAPADWYADPHDPGQLRYWDGSTWTDHRVPSHVNSAELPAATLSAAAVQAPTVPADSDRIFPRTPRSLLGLLGLCSVCLLVSAGATLSFLGHSGLIGGRAPAGKVSTSMTQAAWAAKADAVCRRYSDRTSALETKINEVSNAADDSGTVNTGDLAGALDDGAALFDRQVSDLGRLDRPAATSSSIESVEESLQRYAAKTRTAASAARAGDENAYRDALSQGVDLGDSIDQGFNSLSATECTGYGSGD